VELGDPLAIALAAAALCAAALGILTSRLGDIERKLEKGLKAVEEQLEVIYSHARAAYEVCSACKELRDTVPELAAVERRVWEEVKGLEADSVVGLLDMVAAAVERVLGSRPSAKWPHGYGCKHAGSGSLDFLFEEHCMWVHVCYDLHIDREAGKHIYRPTLAYAEPVPLGCRPKKRTQG